MFKIDIQNTSQTASRCKHPAEHTGLHYQRQPGDNCELSTILCKAAQCMTLQCSVRQVLPADRQTSFRNIQHFSQGSCSSTVHRPKYPKLCEILLIQGGLTNFHSKHFLPPHLFFFLGFSEFTSSTSSKNPVLPLL